MNRTVLHSTRQWLVISVAAALLAGCADEAPLAPDSEPAIEAQFASLADRNTDRASSNSDRAIVTLKRVTARYHNIDAAIADGFELLHPCEERPGEGPVGAVYVHFGRLLDGIIDPATPDALIYEPGPDRMNLVGVEFAIPYSLWTEAEPPSFMGATFQPEDEFGVWALHVWVWRKNPRGIFAESHPRVSCGAA